MYTVRTSDNRWFLAIRKQVYSWKINPEFKNEINPEYLKGDFHSSYIKANIEEFENEFECLYPLLEFVIKNKLNGTFMYHNDKPIMRFNTVYDEGWNNPEFKVTKL